MVEYCQSMNARTRQILSLQGCYSATPGARTDTWLTNKTLCLLLQGQIKALSLAQ